MTMTAKRPMWSPEIWETIDQAILEENRRTEIAAKFLPQYGPMRDALTVPSDTTLTDSEKRPFFKIDEAATVPLVEIWVELVLTPQQVEREMDLKTARTLAIRATNFLVKGQDTLIFQGQAATRTPLFTSKRVQFRSGPAGPGLLNEPLPKDQVVTVRSLEPGKPLWRERTLEAVTEGIARLKAKGEYGPYALVLGDLPYGDAFSPLSGTMITAADRIVPLMEKGFYGTGTLPAEPVSTGLLVSLEGNTVDLVVGYDGIVSFLQEDDEGFYRFRVAKRFALRLKESGAVIKLAFEQ